REPAAGRGREKRGGTDDGCPGRLVAAHAPAELTYVVFFRCVTRVCSFSGRTCVFLCVLFAKSRLAFSSAELDEPSWQRYWQDTCALCTAAVLLLLIGQLTR
ncbi:unnamed protein product, partial [Ectocarpus sp. 8 AP-2014]